MEKRANPTISLVVLLHLGVIGFAKSGSGIFVFMVLSTNPAGV